MEVVLVLALLPVAIVAVCTLLVRALTRGPTRVPRAIRHMFWAAGCLAIGGLLPCTAILLLGRETLVGLLPDVLVAMLVITTGSLTLLKKLAERARARGDGVPHRNWLASLISCMVSLWLSMVWVGCLAVIMFGFVMVTAEHPDAFSDGQVHDAGIALVVCAGAPVLAALAALVLVATIRPLPGSPRSDAIDAETRGTLSEDVDGDWIYMDNLEQDVGGLEHDERPLDGAEPAPQASYRAWPTPDDPPPYAAARMRSPSWGYSRSQRAPVYRWS